MRTKQLRINDPAQLQSRLQGLVGKHLNLVLTDNTTQTGTLENVTGTSFVFRDMRLKKTVYKLDQIAEIYFDTIV